MPREGSIGGEGRAWEVNLSLAGIVSIKQVVAGQTCNPKVTSLVKRYVDR